MMDTREKVFKKVVTLQPFFDVFVDLSQICLLFYRKLSPFSHFLRIRKQKTRIKNNKDTNTAKRERDLFYITYHGLVYSHIKYP